MFCEWDCFFIKIVFYDMVGICTYLDVYDILDVWRCPFLCRWGLVAMLCSPRYCTCPGLCRNEEMEPTWILTRVFIRQLLHPTSCPVMFGPYEMHVLTDGGEFKLVNCNVA